MGDKEVKSLMKVIGISATVVGGLVIVGVVFVAYKNYFDLKKTKLEILKLKRQLGLSSDDKGLLKD